VRESDREEPFRRTYRAVSSETTPPALDRRILASARTSRIGMVTMRPLALAAVLVIGIGLALEYATFSQAIDDAASGEGDMAPDTVLPSKDGSAPRSAPAGSWDRRAVSPASSNGSTMSVPTPNGEEFNAVLERLENTRRTSNRSADDRLHLEGTRAEARQSPRECDETRTTDAASWYACILELRRSGRQEAAEQEMSLLRSAYPDFEIR